MLHQVADEVKLTFPHGKVQGRRVVVLAGEQRRTALRQLFHALQIAITAGGEHIPDIRGGRAAAVEFDGPCLPHLKWLNHVRSPRSPDEAAA